MKKHPVKMYRRNERTSGNPADPLVSWRDHHSGEGHMMYTEDSYNWYVRILEKHGGMNVFINNKDEGERLEM